LDPAKGPIETGVVAAVSVLDLNPAGVRKKAEEEDAVFLC
jgi:hypothetical protein